jgi:hypothetical protein
LTIVSIATASLAVCEVERQNTQLNRFPGASHRVPQCGSAVSIPEKLEGKNNNMYMLYKLSVIPEYR